MPLLLAFLVGCGWHGPDCEDVSFGEVTVDLQSGEPVIAWTGDPADALSVYEGAAVANGRPFNEIDPPGAEVWDVSCPCLSAVEHPGSNRGCTNSDEDIEFRACLQPGVSYGDAPAAAVDEPAGGRQLVSGRVYTAAVVTYCTGPRTVDDSNGGTPYHPHQVTAFTTFTAP
jgi:hypothetical protein